MKQEIIDKIKAGYPCLYVITSEDQRTENVIHAVTTELNTQLLAWNIHDGLVNADTGDGHGKDDPLEVLDEIATSETEDGKIKILYLLRDMHLHMDEPSATIIASFKRAIRECKATSKTMVITGCRQIIPSELQKEITVIEFGLPDGPTRHEVLKTIAEGRVELNGGVEEILRASAGLTTVEAENAFALSLVKTKGFDAEIIHREKANTLKKNGLLEVIESPLSLADVGGLDLAKDWISKRVNAFSKEAREFGLPVPKGFLLIGIPGTGKSLVAKVTSKILGVPILRLDVGKLFGSLVGQSEERVREAIQLAESVSPCVLWIDEIEKGFSGSKSSGSTDGGTSSRVFGSFITWMQEKESPVFVVATANDVSQLPPEMLRKGRFDELFFVDMPTTKERHQIWEVLLGRYAQAIPDCDVDLLAGSFADYTGAEIEQAIINAMYDCFENKEEMNHDLLSNHMRQIVPLSKTMATEVDALRKWADGKARSASTTEKRKRSTGRKITV